MNLYHGTEFMHYRKRWLPEAKATTMQIPPAPIFAVDRSRIDFERRKRGTIVFLKNGNSPEARRKRWEEVLPPGAARLCNQMANELMPIATGRSIVHIGDFVAEYLESR